MSTSIKTCRKIKATPKVCKPPSAVPTLKHESLSEGNSWILSGKVPKELEMDKATFKSLWDTHPEEFNEVKMFGKMVLTPRWQQSYGQPYYYSGLMHEALPIEHPYLKRLLAWVNKHSGKEYKQVLVNWYKDGTHYIGPHSDDETQLVKCSAIYSFSYGQTRIFRITSKADKKDKTLSAKERFRKDVTLTHNSLVIMGGEMQKYYHHEVPKRAASTTPNPRINITFRLFK